MTLSQIRSLRMKKARMGCVMLARGMSFILVELGLQAGSMQESQSHGGFHPNLQEVHQDVGWQEAARPYKRSLGRCYVEL